MKAKYIEHTVENLMEYAKDILLGADEESDYLQAVKALEVAKDFLYKEFKFDPETGEYYDQEYIITKIELDNRIDSLKAEIGNRMLHDYKLEVEKILGITFNNDEICLADLLF
ncbi:hypothetical protein HMPREF0991_02777 [Lachnospiraceae bacterium 2_1_58FAA]|uniref:hypothetical protein n=1 Tax=Mediterraneibacter gnavus TaxID=33038 RepID=UPI0002135BD4|nr:hypothetical protein [Mediterraneibacter gnavus]EGN45083.1 hypothetical protein HMPREF0991_02777 [Lachnospiraceae bacterium 2_1_58FAA]